MASIGTFLGYDVLFSSFAKLVQAAIGILPNMNETMVTATVSITEALNAAYAVLNPFFPMSDLIAACAFVLSFEIFVLALTVFLWIYNKIRGAG